MNALAIDPVVPHNVTLAAPSGLFRSNDVGTDIGVFTSPDGGLTWAKLQATVESEPVALTLDPRHPATLFALLAEGTLLRSDDSGETWLPRQTSQ